MLFKLRSYDILCMRAVQKKGSNRGVQSLTRLFPRSYRGEDEVRVVLQYAILSTVTSRNRFFCSWLALFPEWQRGLEAEVEFC